MAAARSLAAVLVMVCAAGGRAGAQEPPRPPADTARPVPDTLLRDTIPPRRVVLPRAGEAAPEDTVPGDTTRQRAAPGDTVPAAADTLAPVPEMPRFPDPVAPGWAAGVWEWEREALARTGALSLGELLRDLAGIVLLRGGFTGMPEAVTAFGLGGGRVRVFLDGFELDPLEGQALDLSRVKLAGLDRVRLERGAGELRIDLRTISPFERRPYSLVDAGTGDLQTNYFRGVFAHPRALGGSLSLGMERLDTEGTRRAQPASGFTTWVKYSLLEGSRGGIQLEWRHHRGTRDTLFLPSTVTRGDVILRARGELAGGVVLDAFVGRSTASGEDPELEAPVELSARQAGARLYMNGGPAWARAALRLRDAAGLPGTSLEVEGGARVGRVLNVEGGIEGQDWGRESAWTRRGRIVVGPVLGVGAFAVYEAGRRGAPFVGAADTVPGLAPRLAERTALRVGAEWRRGELGAGAAAVRLEADSLVPLGFGPDTSAAVTGGGRRSGVEAYVRVPLLPRGLRLEGVWQGWDGGAPWPYVPSRVWSGGLVYQRVFLPSENLEVLAGLRARGRSAMTLPVPDPQDPVRLAVAPPFESWSVYVQIRVITVRVFVVWENITNRLDQHDFARRTFPGQHAVYGVRWVMWN